MANKRSNKSLKVSDIQTVDENGTILPDAMNEIAAETHVTVSAEPKERKPLATVELDAGILGKIIANTYAPYPGYGTAFSFGVLKGAHKWHANEHFQIMGVINAIASARLGHYMVVEEGAHLKQTFESIRRNKVYEGTFGYICFETLTGELLAEFERRGLMPKDHSHEDEWHKFVIEDKKVTWGHWVKPATLEATAKKLGVEVAQLTPITRKNVQHEWNTYHKRFGLEAVLRASRGETHIIAAVNEVMGQPLKGREWVIGVETGRFAKLYGPLADLAKAMGDAANSGEAQVQADQEGFLGRDAPIQPVEEWAASVGKLVCYQGETYTPSQLVRANVAKMRGDFEVVASLFLRDLSMVKKQWEIAQDEKMTFRVNRLAQ